MVMVLELESRESSPQQIAVETERSERDPSKDVGATGQNLFLIVCHDI